MGKRSFIKVAGEKAAAARLGELTITGKRS